jgi:hypothetical protein
MDGNISKSKSQSNKKNSLEKNTNYSLNIINPNFHKVEKYNISLEVHVDPKSNCNN